MASSTLTAIRTKIRRLTRTPSQNQMTDSVLDDYINTFIQYDIPENVRLFNNRTQMSFFTIPYVDQYPTNTVSTTDPLYNFKNKYIDVFEPIYVAGIKAFYTQSREQFYNIYPINRNIQNIGSGDGIAVNFSGTLSDFPVAQRNVNFTSIGANNSSLALQDVPVFDANGNATSIGNLYAPFAVPATPPTVVTPTNTINYATGVYSITFSGAPQSNASVNADTLPYTGSRPQSVLYWSNIFILRPIPTAVYEINVEVDIRPVELLQSNQSPALEQWWQYIAYGAAKKILEDRVDMETVSKIMPEFENQERLVLRTTLVQQTAERTATIYTEQTTTGYSNFYRF